MVHARSCRPSPPGMGVSAPNPPLRPQAALGGQHNTTGARVRRGGGVGSRCPSIPCRERFGRGRQGPWGRGCSAGPLCPPQHFALFLKYVIQVAIPDIPAWVAEEMAKLEYQRREAFKVGDAGMAPSSGPGTQLAPPVPGAGGLPAAFPGLDVLPVGRSTSGRPSTTSSSSSGASGRRRSGSGTPSTRPARNASPAATRPSPKPAGRTRPTRRARAKGRAPGVPRTAPTSPSDPAPSWPPTT